MMLMPSRDGFLTQLQETGHAVATVTASDDMAISVPKIAEAASEAGIEVRVFILDRNTLSVMAR